MSWIKRTLSMLMVAMMITFLPAGIGQQVGFACTFEDSVDSAPLVPGPPPEQNNNSGGSGPRGPGPGGWRVGGVNGPVDEFTVGYLDWFFQRFVASACTETPMHVCDDGSEVEDPSDCDYITRTTGPHCVDPPVVKRVEPVHKAEAVVRILDTNHVTTKNRLSFEVEVTGTYTKIVSNVPCVYHDHYQSGYVDDTRRAYAYENANRPVQIETSSLLSLKVLKEPMNAFHVERLSPDSFSARWSLYSPDGYDVWFEAEFDIPELSPSERTFTFKGTSYHWPNGEVTSRVFVENPEPYVYR